MFDQYLTQEEARLDHKERLQDAANRRRKSKRDRARKATLPVASTLITFLRGY